MINYLEKPQGWDQGIYQLDSYEQYASIKALRSSELKHMRKSPAHFKASFYYQKPITPIQQKTFDKGKAFDILILHGQDRLDRKVAIELNANKNSNIYKEWKARQGGKIILKQNEYNNVITMRNAAHNKKQFSEIFDGPGHPHRVIVWQDKGSGIWCKAEIDWIKEGMPGAVVDLKSTSDASFWFFFRNARRLGYMNQGAFYLDGLSQITGVLHTEFYLAAVEVDPPFESHVFKASFDQLDRAQIDNEERLLKLAQCFEKDEWPGYRDEILDLDSGQYIEDYESLDEMEEEDYDSQW